MSPQQMLSSVTQLDWKTLLVAGGMTVSATVYIVNNVGSTKVLETKVDTLDESITAYVGELNAKILGHEEKPEHNGANVRLSVLEHQLRQQEKLVERQDAAFRDLNNKLDRILARIGTDLP